MGFNRSFAVGVLVGGVAMSAPAVAQDTSGAKPEPAAEVSSASAAPEAKKPEPFTFADFTSLTGNARTKDALRR